METTKNKTITIETLIDAAIDTVWDIWTDAKHIVKWNNASDDWHTSQAINDLRVGGRFNSRMEAKDGSSGFNFTGRYTKVENHKEIECILDDGRKVHTWFEPDGKKTKVTEAFETEDTNSHELQKSGWQAILNNFKKYVESSGAVENLHFDIMINAGVDKVYKMMLDKKSYEEWTSIFNPTSHFIGTWEKGSKMIFIGEDKDGGQGGMVSTIKEHIPNRFLSIEHIGLYKDGEEIYIGAEVDSWAGAMENYSFREEIGQTIVSVNLEGLMEYKSYFLDTWPKALKKLKEICER